MAIGRITGQMLSSTLSRGTTNLTLGTTGQSNLFHVDATNDRIGIGLNNPSVQLQTTGSAIVGTDLTVTGNLTVNGSTTTVNTTNMTVDDKNIELSHSLSGNSPTDAAADGGGIILKGDTDHTILWNNATDDWDFSENIDIAAGKVYKLGGSTILGANSLDLENIQIAGNVITTASNADLSLQPSGTGAVKIEGIRIQGDVITSDDSSVVQFGEGAAVNGNFNVGGSLQLSQSTAVTSILDEDNLSSNSATALATQQSIKAYVDSVSGGSLTLGDSSSNAGAVNINGDEQLIFRSGDSITATVAGNGVTFDLNETISVDTITAGDSSAITINSPTILSSSLKFGDTVAVTSIVDEDNMASNSATALATQQSIKAYVDAQLTAQDLDFQGDSGGALSIDLDSETLDIAGGTGIDTAGSGNTLTVAIDSTVATLTGSQTLTNKTLTSPVLNTGVSGTAILDEDDLATDSNTQLATQQSIKAFVTSGTITMTNKTTTNLVLNGTATGTAIKDEDNMASNSATHLATQQSIKAYVDSKAGGTLSIGDSASNSGSVDVNGDEALEFRAGNSITPTVAGNGVTLALNDAIVVNAISSSDSTFVRINDSLETENAQINTNLTVDGNAQVKGNLTVQGTTTYIETTNTKVSDPLLLLNNGNSGGSDIDSGIMVERGSAGNNAVFYWNEGDDRFKAVLSASEENATSVTDTSYATVNLGGLVFGAESVVATSIKDEDAFGSNSATALATQQSIKAYVDAQDAAIASDSLTFTNKTIDANGTGNSITNLEVADFTAASIVIESEGLASSDNDTSLPTTAAVKDYVDANAGGTLKLADSSSNSGSVNVSGSEDLVFRSGDSISVAVAGNGVTVNLNETISVDTITAGDSSAITVGSAMKSTSSFGFDGSVQVTSILDEDAMGSNSATALATQQSIKAYTDSATQTMSNKTLTSPVLNGTISGTGFKDEDGMDSNSATALASQQSIKAYVDAQDAAIASDSLTFTNKTFDADGTGNSITNLAVADFAAAAIVTEAEGISSNDNDNTLPTSAAVKDLVDASKVDNLNDVGDVDAASKSDGDVLVVNDDSSDVFTTSSQLVTGMRVPAGTTANRPTAYRGIIRYNTSTGLYEGSTDGSTFTAFAMAGTAESLNKDVFAGNGGASYNFSNVSNPSNQSNSNGALGLLVYIDNVLQEPTQNYTINNTAITFDSAVHSGARIVVIQGFDGGAGTGTGAGWKNVLNTDVDSAIENVDTFDKATFRAAKYAVTWLDSIES